MLLTQVVTALALSKRIICYMLYVDILMDIRSHLLFASHLTAWLAAVFEYFRTVIISCWNSAVSHQFLNLEYTVILEKLMKS